jgi:hypothetical protein
VRVNSWLVLREAARAFGFAVLPCYLGDDDPALRLGPIWRTWRRTNGCWSIATCATSRACAP